MLLPQVEILDEYRRIYRKEAVWLPAMVEICDRHGLDSTLLAFAPPGSHVVFRDEHHITASYMERLAEAIGRRVEASDQRHGAD